MESKLIDLRSDTVTRPSPGMRRAMAEAKVGDDVYGEDPTVNELEELCAEVTGKESALFVPSGSMANLIAQMIYVRRGDEVIIGAGSHCYRYEVGAGAAIAGAQYVVIEGNGTFTAQDVQDRIRTATFHRPGTALVWIENTHNFGGGIIFPFDEIKRISNVCKERGIPMHMDGARIFNAVVATGIEIKKWCQFFDSLSFCFSKGLGAPVGSILCGTRGMKEEGKRFRKMLGGGMRQAGILAAAAIYALKNNIERLAEDHANAKYLAENLSDVKQVKIDMKTVQTNIVMADLEGINADTFVKEIAKEGVLVNAISSKRVRFVTHLDVSKDDISQACAIIRKVLH